jgi:steroid Delta-isomerase
MIGIRGAVMMAGPSCTAVACIAMSNVADAVDAFVERFNAAVRSGDWTAFAAGHAEDATVHFHGVPLPPIHGRRSIAERYAADPPHDTITVLDKRADGDQVHVRFAWDASPDQPFGTFRLTFRDGLVAENHIELSA